MVVIKGVKDRIDIKVVAEVDQDLGKTLSISFVATYKVLPFSESKALLQRMNSEEGVDDDEVMDILLLGWKGLLDDSGEHVEFTPDSLAAYMESVPYRKALAKGAMEAILGKDAIRKN